MTTTRLDQFDDTRSRVAPLGQRAFLNRARFLIWEGKHEHEVPAHPFLIALSGLSVGFIIGALVIFALWRSTL